MTEAEWMGSSDLNAMLDALGGEVSDSKLRLFACACVRLIWDHIETDLHRRVVAYAEWFARGPGRDLCWIGSGHWLTGRRLSRPFETIERTDGWEALQQELAGEEAAISEEMAALRYVWATPPGAATGTLALRYDMPWAVAHAVAAIRTAPFAYWQHDRMPELAEEVEDRWFSRTRRELASYCDLLREIYGRPDLGPSGDAAAPGARGR